MEEINAIVQVLGNGFFPIAVCGVLFWYVNKKDKLHKEEIEEVKKSIDGNTKAISKLVTSVEELIKKEIEKK